MRAIRPLDACCDLDLGRRLPWDVDFDRRPELVARDEASRGRRRRLNRRLKPLFAPRQHEHRWQRRHRHAAHRQPVGFECGNVDIAGDRSAGAGPERARRHTHLISARIEIELREPAHACGPHPLKLVRRQLDVDCR